MPLIVQKFGGTSVADAEKIHRAARRAIRAIRRNEGLALVTWMAHVLWRLKRFAPGLLDSVQRFGRKRRNPSALEPLGREAAAGETPAPLRRAA